MSSRSLGELLLCPTSLSRLSCAQNFRRAAAPSWTAYRTISTSSPAQAAQPQPKKDTPNDTPSQPAPQASAERTSEAIDNLFSSMPAFSRQSPSAFKRASPQESAERARNVFGSNFSNARSGSGMTPRLDFDSMSMDGLPLNLPYQPSAVAPLEPEKQIYPRLNPAFGRTVDLKPETGRDLVRGINMLGSLMARNKVKADFMKQKFHERPGLKRKRLNSERWRARFRKGFQEVTGRVSELTRKGW
jgi:small subunit ribosomal protein MRP21